MKGTKTQKGITIIALIITIIVLLILAVVAIGAVRDGGIITHAQNAASDYTIAQEKEQIGLALSEWQIQKNNPSNTETFKKVMEDALSETAIVSGEDDGPLTITMNATGNKYKVTGEGTITQVEVKEGSSLEKYILGANLEGRDFTQIMDMGNMSFKNEESTISNAETTLTLLTTASDEEDFIIVYFRDSSDQTSYKFGLNYYYNEETDEERYETDTEYGVVKLYKPEEGTRVGKTVKYDNKIWTILYDDSTNGLQMICNQSLLYNDSEFWLGYQDSLITSWDSLITVADLDKSGDLNSFEKSVYSYNNAIDTLNTACKNIVAANDNITDVRCVGSNPTNKSAENKTLYTSENLSKWPINNATYAAGIGNGIGKSTDSNYVFDFDRMVALGINIGYDSAGEGASYWLASRFVDVYSDHVSFGIRYVHSDGYYDAYYLWRVYESRADGESNYYALRPVVSLKTDIQLVADTTGEADYTF